MEPETYTSSLLKNPLLSSSGKTPMVKNAPTVQNSMVNPNVSQSSNNLNTSVSNDTLKILNLLKTQPSNHPSSIPEYTYDDIKGICLRVFMSYAKPRNGRFFLSYLNLQKILKAAFIINESNFTAKDADILTQKINKGFNPFTSEDVLNYLTRVCSVVESNFYSDKKGKFINFIKRHLEPLIMKIETGNDVSMFTPLGSSSRFNDKNFYNEISKSNISNSYAKNNNNLNICVNFQRFIDNYSLDENTYLILTSISPGLKQIYLIYFRYETNRHHDLQKIENGSFKNFMEFSRDFQMTPYLISKNTLELYWSMIIATPIEQLINNQSIKIDKFNEEQYNIGTIYTFGKFLLYFAHIAAFYYNSLEISNGEKLLYLIEKIYSSRGYTNLAKKSSVPYNMKLSIVPPKEVIELVNRRLLEESEKEKMRKKRTYTNWHQDIKEFLELNSENYDILRPYIEKMRNIFGIYCKIGDKLQYGKMSFSNYQKMLIDGGLLFFKRNKQSSCNTLSKRKLNLTIYENNTNMGRFSNSTFNFNFNTINANVNPVLSKSMSQQLFANKNFLDSTLIGSSSNRNFSLEPKKNKTKLNISDINLIYSKISGFINFNSSKDRYKDKIYRNVTLDKSQFLNMSSSKPNGPFKLDFFLFRKTIPLIALRFYPNDTNDLNEAMSLFLEKKFPSFIDKISDITEMYSDTNELIQLMDQVAKNETLQKLKKDISPLIQKYFKFYTEIINKKNRMTFEHFIFFFKDFNIYPHWMSMVNLKEIFYGEVNRKKETGEELDLSSLLNCLLIIAICMNTGDDFSWADKVLFMLDKMFAEGGEQTMKKTGFTL